jgi:hypothetical protein
VSKLQPNRKTTANAREWTRNKKQVQTEINATRFLSHASVNLGHLICAHLRLSAVCLYSCPFVSIRG